MVFDSNKKRSSGSSGTNKSTTTNKNKQSTSSVRSSSRKTSARFSNQPVELLLKQLSLLDFEDIDASCKANKYLQSICKVNQRYLCEQYIKNHKDIFSNSFKLKPGENPCDIVNMISRKNILKHGRLADLRYFINVTENGIYPPKYLLIQAAIKGSKTDLFFPRSLFDLYRLREDPDVVLAMAKEPFYDYFTTIYGLPRDLVAKVVHVIIEEHGDIERAAWLADRFRSDLLTGKKLY